MKLLPIALCCSIFLAACGQGSETKQTAPDTTAEGYIVSDPNVTNSEATGAGATASPGSDTSSSNSALQSHSSTPTPEHNH